ncbi:hypothetical protein A1O3_06525 [Capronia epimyces CBS 606.96]|uniref:Uncharacterized protein n=1 Tax=Capronia epimyces CBS 606.96 TaxID=1182542 RepID=W9Y0E5_9EURO|nr:uncharacterized protein A1O3_06525 [Capronia epimyces CBS 606.96]EXJ82711.1 hypothetical protein A1O3_06525 [Capronia epimyces CBS 606.96]
MMLDSVSPTTLFGEDDNQTMPHGKALIPYTPISPAFAQAVFDLPGHHYSIFAADNVSFDLALVLITAELNVVFCIPKVAELSRQMRRALDIFQ